jgi:hypothetical protein
MTYTKEVACYAVAHVVGFILSALLTSFVMVPIYTSTRIAAQAGSRYLVAFIFFAVVQTVVFGIFIAMRGRPGVPR